MNWSSALTVAALLAPGPQVGAAAPTISSAGELQVPVTATDVVVERKIARHLTLRVRRDSIDSNVGGWEVEVRDDRRPSGGNLLYHSRLWHGPYPTQVDAWTLDAGLFPRERRLPVRGHPWEVTISCSDCVTARDGQQARLVSGILRVRWDRR